MHYYTERYIKIFSPFIRTSLWAFISEKRGAKLRKNAKGGEGKLEFNLRRYLTAHPTPPPVINPECTPDTALTFFIFDVQKSQRKPKSTNSTFQVVGVSFLCGSPGAGSLILKIVSFLLYLHLYRLWGFRQIFIRKFILILNCLLNNKMYLTDQELI